MRMLSASIKRLRRSSRIVTSRTSRTPWMDSCSQCWALPRQLQRRHTYRTLICWILTMKSRCTRSWIIRIFQWKVTGSSWSIIPWEWLLRRCIQRLLLLRKVFRRAKQRKQRRRHLLDREEFSRRQRCNKPQRIPRMQVESLAMNSDRDWIFWKHCSTSQCSCTRPIDILSIFHCPCCTRNRRSEFRLRKCLISLKSFHRRVLPSLQEHSLRLGSLKLNSRRIKRSTHWQMPISRSRYSCAKRFPSLLWIPPTISLTPMSKS